VWNCKSELAKTMHVEKCLKEVTRPKEVTKGKDVPKGKRKRTCQTSMDFFVGRDSK
jgi:hypothetical protein